MANADFITSVTLIYNPHFRSIIAFSYTESGVSHFVAGNSTFQYGVDPNNEIIQAILEAYQSTDGIDLFYDVDGTQFAETAEKATAEHLAPQKWMEEANYFLQVTLEAEEAETPDEGEGPTGQSEIDPDYDVVVPLDTGNINALVSASGIDEDNSNLFDFKVVDQPHAGNTLIFTFKMTDIVGAFEVVLDRGSNGGIFHTGRFFSSADNDVSQEFLFADATANNSLKWNIKLRQTDATLDLRGITAGWEVIRYHVQFEDITQGWLSFASLLAPGYAFWELIFVRPIEQSVFDSFLFGLAGEGDIKNIDRQLFPADNLVYEVGDEDNEAKVYTFGTRNHHPVFLQRATTDLQDTLDKFVTFAFFGEEGIIRGMRGKAVRDLDSGKDLRMRVWARRR